MFNYMVSQIYHSELQLNEANISDTEAAIFDLHLSISNDIVSTKTYDKRDDFDFPIFRRCYSLYILLEFIFLNSSDFLEHLAMLMTSTLAINC